MVYDNEQVRRRDRLLSEQRAMELLREGEYGVLAMAAEEGGYGIPLNYAAEGDSIYFHCAPEGEKLRNIRHDSRVSFTVVGKTQVLSSKYTTLYESIVCRGRVEVVTDSDERHDALRLILEKYSDEKDWETGLKYIAGSLHRTTVLRLNIETISGKSKSMAL